MSLILPIKFTLPFSAIFAALSNFLLIMILARQVPSEEYARIINIKALILILSSFFSLGLSQSYIHSFSKLETSKAIENKQLKLTVYLGIISSVIANCWIWYSGISLSHIFISYLLITIIFIIYMINNELINFLRASMRFSLVAYLTILRSFMLVATALIFLEYVNNHLAYLFSFLCTELILLIPFSKFRNQGVNTSNFPVGYFKYGIVHGVIIAATFLFYYIDKLTISISANSLVRVTEYDLATILSVSLFGLLGRTFNVFLFPTLSSLKSLEFQLNNTFRKCLKVHSIISIIITVFLAYCTPLITQAIFKVDISVWNNTLIYGILGYHFLGACGLIATIMYVTGGTKNYLIAIVLSLALYILLIVIQKISTQTINIFDIPKFLLISTGSCCLMLIFFNYRRLDVFSIALLLLPIFLIRLNI